MKGVILAGGSGSRMRPATEAYTKSACLVYDKPMIHYPLTTLAEMGCDSAVIVASPSGVGDISRMIKDGSAYGLDVEYKVQNEPNGVAGAILRAATCVKGVFPLILGDCYYDPAPPVVTVPTLYWHEFETATEHSIWHPESDAIIEKPRLVDLGNRAIVSYFYDENLFEYAASVKPAHGSSELEIVDVHNYYRMNGAQMVEYTGYFADMGTPDGLLRAANHIKENK